MTKVSNYALIGLLFASIGIGCGPGSGSSYRAYYSGADGLQTKKCINRVQRSTDDATELLGCRGVWESPYPCDATDTDDQADFCLDVETRGGDDGDGVVIRYVLVAIALVVLVVLSVRYAGEGIDN